MEKINQIYNSVENMPEKEKPRLVSRVFMLQSANREMIEQKLASGTKIGDLNFVNNIVALKANVQEAKNPNQLMPVGGNINLKQEKLRVGTAREMQEETYVRPMPNNQRSQPVATQQFKNMFRYLGKQNFVLGGKPVQTVYSAAYVSPYDAPHLLDPDEDKFSRYYHLDADQMNHLFDTGRLPKMPGYTKKRLVDSLSPLEPDPKARIQATNINQKEVKRVKNNLIKYQRQAELRKKENLLNIIFSYLDKNFDANKVDIQNELKLLNNIQNYEAMQEYYKKVVNEYGFSQEIILEAIRLSNLEEEMGYLEKSQNSIEIILRILAILPSDPMELTGLDIKILKKSPVLKPILEKLNKLKLFDRTKNVNKIDTWDATKVEDNQKVAKILENIFNIQRENFKEAGIIHDHLIEKINKTIVGQDLSEDFNISHVELIDEIVNCEPVQLIQFATGQGGVAQKFKKTNPLMFERLCWEAKRKIIFMMIISDILDYRQQEFEKGNVTLEKLWDKLLSPPKEIKITEIYGNKNQLVDILTPATKTRDKQLEIDIKMEAGDVWMKHPTTDYMREIELNGKKIGVRVYERSFKDTEQAARKAMTRSKFSTRPDYHLADFYARALVFDTNDKKLLKRDDKKIKYMKFDKSKNEYIENEEIVNDYNLIFYLIERLKNCVPEGWKFDILKYTKTPEGENYRLKGEGVGTGGKVKLGKFIILLTNPEQKQFQEEIQFFVPDFGKSGYYYYQEKIDDDLRYQIERLKEVSGLRSIIEKYFPYKYYKVIGEVYKKNKSD